MVDAAVSELVTVLRNARTALAHQENDFTWSSWKDAEAALREVDDLISTLQAGTLPPRLDLEVLFAPTGPIQEVSLSSGWAEPFLGLARRFDAAMSKLYAAQDPTMMERAKKLGLIPQGQFRVVVIEEDLRVTSKDVGSLEEARSYANDVCSENDSGTPPVAHVFDDGFEVVHTGQPYFNR
jgi:hypothetical protein